MIVHFVDYDNYMYAKLKIRMKIVFTSSQTF